jgi:hypothetical protein
VTIATQHIIAVRLFSGCQVARFDKDNDDEESFFYVAT